MKTDLFQYCGATAEFSKFAGILSATLSQHHLLVFERAVPSPLLALFIVMLPKVHLTSHSRMAGSMWVITLSWLSGSCRSFLYRSSVYSCHLFLISSASVRSIPFLSFIVPFFAWNVSLVYQFSWRDLYSFPFCCFSLFLCIVHLERLSYLSLALLWNSAFKWVYLSFSPLPLASLFFLS